MSYCFSTTLRESRMADVVEKVTAALKEEGFGVLFDLDIASTLKEKLDVKFKPYRILGACNPGFAHLALLNEEKVGLLLPCNVIVIDHGDGDIEVAAVDPLASMQAVENEALDVLADEVRKKLRRVIDGLNVGSRRLSRLN